MLVITRGYLITSHCPFSTPPGCEVWRRRCGGWRRLPARHASPKVKISQWRLFEMTRAGFPWENLQENCNLIVKEGQPEENLVLMCSDSSPYITKFIFNYR